MDHNLVYRIFKYVASNQETITNGVDTWYVKYTYDIPYEANVRKVGFQHGSLTLWCEVPVEGLNDVRKRTINLVPTGGYINVENWFHLDTIFVGELVWHIYEEITYDEG